MPRILSSFLPLLLLLALAVPPSAAAESNSNLVLDGIPPIPDDLVARLTQYESTRWASMRSLSDDGSQVLITTRLGDTGQVHLVAQPGGARQQVTFRREPSRSPEFVPGSARSFLFRGDIGGNEQNQIFRFDMDTGTTTQLTQSNTRNGSWIWSPSGDRIAYSSTRRNGKDFDIWVSDPTDPTSATLLAEGNGYFGPDAWSPDGSTIVVSEYVSRADSRFHVIDVASGEMKRLVGGTRRDTAYYGTALFGADADTLFITSDRGGEFIHLHKVTRKGRKWVWKDLTPGLSWDISELSVSEDGSRIAFIVNEGGYGTLYLGDAATASFTKQEQLPRGIIYGLQFARSAPVLGFTMAGPTRTGDAWTMDLASGEATQWTLSEMGGLDPSTFIEPTLVEFESFDGRTIPAFYYRPEGEGPFPVQINIHGGPEGQARPYFSAKTQYLLKDSKVAVLVPNVRGSSGYGRSYLALDNGYLREDSVKDIGALLDWLAAQPELDAERVAVAGGSYGGYMVLASLVHFGSRIKAGIDVVGISNFVTFLENTKEYRRDVRRAEYGDERDKKMRAHLEAISPLNHVDKIQSALLVGQGANDPRVPKSEADQIVKKVRESGREAWYFLALDEGHGFSKKPNRDAWTRTSIYFLELSLGLRELAPAASD